MLVDDEQRVEFLGGEEQEGKIGAMSFGIEIVIAIALAIIGNGIAGQVAQFVDDAADGGARAFQAGGDGVARYGLMAAEEQSVEPADASELFHVSSSVVLGGAWALSYFHE